MLPAPRLNIWRRALSTALVALLGVLAGCGGGDGGSSSQPPLTAGPPPAAPPQERLAAVAKVDPGSTLRADWQRGVFMQVFVRSYQDSDGDGIGDLGGLVSRLDYLRDLGISGLWLMPIHPSQDRDHGYAVTDYRDVEPAYGTLADFDTLLREAHARGIGVMLDYVINHSAGAHPLFVNASHDPANAWRDWYVWQPSVPAGWNVFGGNPWRATTNGAYYAPFWDQMPDFNLRNPAVVGFHQDNIRFWLNRGVDGLRFDAVGMLVENGPAAWENQPESRALMGGMRELVGSYARRHLVCEAPADSRGFAAAMACGSAFAFDLKDDLIGAARGQADSVRRVAAYFESAPLAMATLLANHDGFAGQRLWDQFAGDEASYRMAAAAYLLLPGTPFVYYGEEIGMAGAASLSGDPRLRTPMSWTADARTAGFTSGSPYRALSSNAGTRNVAAQAAQPDSLLAFYRSLIALRNTRAELSTGRYEAAFASGLAMGYQRATDNTRSLVLLNFGRGPVNLDVASLGAAATLQALYPADGLAATADADGRARITLGPQSVRVMRVLRP